MDFLKIHYKVLIPLILLVIVGFIYLRFAYEKEAQKQVAEVTPTEVGESSPKKFYVDIKGEVQNPGVYEITEETRIQDLIALAGGLTADADTSSINLASTLVDGMMLVIPKIAEEPEQNVSQPQAPVTQNNKVSLNNATLEQLMTLPGIGQSKAEKIIAYRNTYGLFKSISEIQNVSGIGSATYEKLKDYLTL